MSSFLSKVIKNGLMKNSYISSLKYFPVRHSSLWEPDYLILGKTKTPEYDLINFQIKGYDFVVLESYQSFIHKTANMLGVDVSDAWANASKDLKVNTFKPNSLATENEYILHLFERNVQVIDIKSHILPILIDLVISACPPGVKLSVHEHTQEIEDDKYVPDLQIIELEQQLQEYEPKK